MLKQEGRCDDCDGPECESCVGEPDDLESHVRGWRPKKSGEVLEVDGPPCACFDYKKNNKGIRVAYRLFSLRGGTPNSLVEKMFHGVETIRGELGAVGGGVIYWRRRPSVDVVFDGGGDATGRFSASFRVATIPEISESAWSKVFCVRETEGKQP